MDSATPFCMARFVDAMEFERPTLDNYCVIAIAGARYNANPCRCARCEAFGEQANRLLSSGAVSDG